MLSITGIAAATGGRVIGPEAGTVGRIVPDSRSILPGELFVPLRGERFDGHDFIVAAIDRRVTATMAEEAWLATHNDIIPPHITIVAVKDTLQSLGDLATTFRQRFNIPVIGVTGSNGKTTTKEMLAAILNQSGSGLKTKGNLNNLIGLPQMLFQLGPEHRWAVLEMGMSEPGEIDRLAEVASPKVGIVLNAFPAHLESMGSVDNVARAKGELLLRLPPGGSAVVNADDALVAALPTPPGVQRVTFGLAGADVRAANITSLGIEGQRFTLQIRDTSTTSIRLQAFGVHNVYNALAAAAAADSLGITPEAIRAGLEVFLPYDKRFRLERTSGGVVLIDDSYNANPASMKAALTTLLELKGAQHRSFVVLGDMLELGDDENELHHMIGVHAATVAAADRLYLLGKRSKHIGEGAISGGLHRDNIVHADNHEQIVDDLSERIAEGDFVLVKGSRGMKMERVCEGIRNSAGA